jgi:hypothetical protein
MPTTSMSGGGSPVEAVFAKNAHFLGVGHDTISAEGITKGAWGHFGSATLSGGELDGSTPTFAISGSATLLGGLSTDLVKGGGFTSLLGGSAADTFIGGSGADSVAGGFDKHLFDFKSSATVITNFVSGSDSLHLEGHSLAFLDSKSDITSSGGNTLISLGGHTTVELQGITRLGIADETTHKP